MKGNIKLVNILTHLNRGVKPVEKRSSEQKIKILNSFRSKIFPIKNTRSEQAFEPAPEKAPEPNTSNSKWKST